MGIIFEDESGRELPFDGQALAIRVMDAVLDYEGCPYETEVNLLLTTDEGIHEVNKEARGIDRPTDVLSFPALEYEVPGNFDFLEDDEINFNPETGELMFGDILLSIDKVYAQAEEYGHSLEREYAFLIAHSMLHLCGYDHMEPEEACVMESKQQEVMELLGILRG